MADKMAAEDCDLIEDYFGKEKLKNLSIDQDRQLRNLFTKRLVRLQYFTIDIQREIITKFINESVDYKENKEYKGIFSSVKLHLIASSKDQIAQYTELMQIAGRAVLRELKGRLIDCIDEYPELQKLKYDETYALRVEQEAICQLPLDLDKLIIGNKLHPYGNADAIDCIKYYLYEHYRDTYKAAYTAVKAKKSNYVLKGAMPEDLIIHYMSRELEKSGYYLDPIYKYAMWAESYPGLSWQDPKYTKVLRWVKERQAHTTERLEKLKQEGGEAEFENYLEEQRWEPLTDIEKLESARHRLIQIRDFAEHILSEVAMTTRLTNDDILAGYLIAHEIFTKVYGESQYITVESELRTVRALAECMYRYGLSEMRQRLGL